MFENREGARGGAELLLVDRGAARVRFELGYGRPRSGRRGTCGPFVKSKIGTHGSPNLGSSRHKPASEQTLYERQQQYDDGERDDGSRDGPREEHGPVVRKTDHGVHERLFGDRSENDTEHERGDRKLQTLEAIAKDAEADDQPEIRDVVADRQGTDEAEDQDIRRDDGFGKIENLHQWTDGEIPDGAHQRETEEQRSENGVDERRRTHEHLRPWLDAMQHEGTEDHGGRAAAGNAKRKQMDHRAADRGGRGCLRGDDAFSNASTHLVPALAEARLDAVAHE